MLDSYINEEKSVRFQQDSWTLLIDLKSKFVDPEIRTAIIPNRDNSFSAIFAWAASKSLDCKKKAEHFIQQLICMAKQMSNNSYCESVIYGNECNDFSQLYGQLNQIQELIPIKTGFLYGDSISLDDLIIKHRNSMPQALKIAELLYNTAVLHKSGSYYEYNKSIEQLEYYLSANKLGTDALAPFSGFLKGYFNIDLSSRGLEYIFDTLKRLAEDWFNKNIQSSDIVNQTICFINNYYMKDIGIAQIANQLMKVIIDRFEGEFAVVELEDRSFANMPKTLVPVGAGESSVLSIDIDYDQTEKLKVGMSNLMKDIFKE